MISASTALAVLVATAIALYRRKVKREKKSLRKIAQEARKEHDSGEIRQIFKRLKS